MLLLKLNITNWTHFQSGIRKAGIIFLTVSCPKALYARSWWGVLCYLLKYCFKLNVIKGDASIGNKNTSWSAGREAERLFQAWQGVREEDSERYQLPGRCKSWAIFGTCDLTMDSCLVWQGRRKGGGSANHGLLLHPVSTNSSHPTFKCCSIAVEDIGNWRTNQPKTVTG